MSLLSLGRRRRLIGAALALALAGPAQAGPPFITDDPQPTDTGKWEIYNFVSGSRASGSTGGDAGLDLNYGGAPGLQLTAVLPANYVAHRPLTVGFGDVELAVKYKALTQDAAGIDVALFPRLFLPTATDRHGDHSVGLLLPVWLQKDLGGWSLFGGGGYKVGGARDARDHFETGVALSRTFGERGMLGVEVYHNGRETAADRPFTGLNLGGAYKLDRHWSLLGSAGPGLQNAARYGRYSFYLALKADY